MSDLISINNPEGMRALMARKLAKLHPQEFVKPCIEDAPVNQFISGETVNSAPLTPDENVVNASAGLVLQGLSHFEGGSDTKIDSDTKPDTKQSSDIESDTNEPKQQQYRELLAKLRQLEKEMSDPAEAAERTRLMELVPDYWSRFLSVKQNEQLGTNRYQFMFWSELDSADWQDMKSLGVRNQWPNVKPHVQSNPVLASLIDSLGLRAFKTLLTGHSLGLIVQRLQRLLSHHLRISNQPARTVITPVSDTNHIIQLQQAEIRELKIRAGQPVSYQSAIQACVDWVNELDTAVNRLNATGSDTKQSSDTKRRGRQHDKVRDTLVMDLLIREGKSKSEVARSLGVNEKVIRRIVLRYKEAHATPQEKAA